jgi:hypothetical protein
VPHLLARSENDSVLSHGGPGGGIKGLPKLKSLNLSLCAQITDRGVDVLIACLQACLEARLAHSQQQSRFHTRHMSMVALNVQSLFDRRELCLKEVYTDGCWSVSDDKRAILKSLLLELQSDTQ